jgi:pimeloyl-ACP methyl ester carboxylesterase
VVVLVHGITESRHSWRPIIERLSADRRVLAVDLRGHGDSPDGIAYDPISYASDVVETVVAAGVNDPLVVGHSLGGVVVSAYAAIATCRGVVNVDQPLRLASFKEALQQLEPLLKGTTEQFLAARNTMFAMMDGPLPAADRARIDASSRPDQAVVLATWAAVFDSTPDELDASVEALAAGITVPYLSLHGIDPGNDYASWLRPLVPSAEIEVWADQGHYPHLVDTERFLRRLAAFERQVPG